MFIFFFINGAYDDTKISSSKNIYIPVDMGFVGILTRERVEGGGGENTVEVHPNSTQ